MVVGLEVYCPGNRRPKNYCPGVKLVKKKSQVKEVDRPGKILAKKFTLLENHQSIKFTVLEVRPVRMVYCPR